MPRFRPIPKIPYEKFKSKLDEHIWVHYFFHTTFCLVRSNAEGNYKFYTPKAWLERYGIKD